MEFINNYSLKIKILVPILLLIILPLITIMFISEHYYRQIIEEQEIKAVSKKKVKSLKKNLDIITTKNLELASYISSQPIVQEVYEKIVDKPETREENATVLEREINNLDNHLSKMHKMRFKLHFHIPPATSFFRSWENKKFDELSLIRKSIVKVSKAHQPLRGIEIGKYGMKLRSIAPIFSIVNRKYLGSVEVISPIKELFELSQTDKREDFAFFIHKDKINKHKDEMAVEIDTSLVMNDFVLFQKGTKGFQIPIVSQKKLDELYYGFTDYVFHRSGNYQFIFYNLKDINNEQIGLGVYQLNISAYIKDLKTLKIINIGISILYILISLLIVTFIVSLITNPINRVRDIVEDLGIGKLTDEIEFKRNDEVGKMINAVNVLVRGLKKTASFSQEMGSGNFDSHYSPLSKYDTLGNSLINMRKNLRLARKEEEERKIEDQKLQWSNRGQAKFVEILRQSSNNLDLLSNNIIKGLVEYLNANLGGLFILDDSDKNNIYLDLIASYAYNQKKYLSKRIPFGEGLVGMSAKEKFTIYRKDLPDDYIKIRSGLGHANPSSLLIVPLKLDDEILGVVEIASFANFQDFEIEFVEKIAENIASSLSTVRINQKTAQLLEQSRKQAEALENQEVQMRKRIEDMENVKEEAIKEAGEIKGFITSIDSTFIRADFNIDGTLTYANRKFYEAMLYLPTEVEGRHILMFIEDKEQAKFDAIWSRLVSGGNYYEDRIRLLSRHSKVWFFVAFAPVRNHKGEIIKIIFIGVNIDEKRSREILREKEFTAIENSVIKAEYKPNGTILTTNSNYLKTLGFSRVEIQNTNVFNLVARTRKKEFLNLWEKVVNGSPTEYFEKISTKSGEVRYLKGIYASILDYEGVILKVVYIGVDLTNEYLEALKSFRYT